jgi:DNA-binding transcriptional MocR family regulator
MPNVSNDHAIPPLMRQAARKAVRGVMARQILSGQIKPGTTLPAEPDRAARFEVKRSTAREAMRQMELGAWVERRGRKLFVACLSHSGSKAGACRATRAGSGWPRPSPCTRRRVSSSTPWLHARRETTG